MGFLIALGPEALVQLGDQLGFHSKLGRTWMLMGDAGWDLAYIVASFVGMLILFVVGNRVTYPLRRISYAANALAAGDYRRRISITTGDELEKLGKAFNKLGDSLLQHEADIKGKAEMLAGAVEAARLVSSSLDEKTCGKTVARAMCEYLGASSAVVFRKNDQNGGIKVIGRSGTGQTAAWKRLASHSADLGGYLVITEQIQDETDGEACLVGIPLQASDKPMGAIVARFDGGATRNDLRIGTIKSDLLIAFGIHAGAAINNSEAFSRTEHYSEVLEDWVDHLSSVMQVTDAISPSLTLNETMSALTRSTASAMNTDECAIFMPDKNGYLVVESCRDKQDSVLLNKRVRPGESVSGLAFAEKRPVTYFDATICGDEMARQFAESRDLRGMLSVPMIVEDQAIGAITVYDRKARQFRPDEIRLLTSIALHAAVIVRNASLYTKESSIAETLQRGLMSETPESCKGLRFASRYIPALDEARVGGDFYEVTELPDGRVAIVMGDVSGKGLDAAIHLATCKNMHKALMYANPNDPALVLRELNNALNFFFELSFFVTIFYGVIDTEAGTITYANAGHPPGLLISANGKMHDCLSATGMPAGAGQKCNYTARTINLSPSDMLLILREPQNGEAGCRMAKRGASEWRSGVQNGEAGCLRMAKRGASEWRSGVP
ncbi:MAG: SpoIIE family protein phosphatase [Armatimonadetes bacterium]|nr:SpoIIE family protein phosphatase [Armatimonadota bacterium]